MLFDVVLCFWCKKIIMEFTWTGSLQYMTTSFCLEGPRCERAHFPCSMNKWYFEATVEEHWQYSVFVIMAVAGEDLTYDDLKEILDGLTCHPGRAYLPHRSAQCDTRTSWWKLHLAYLLKDDLTQTKWKWCKQQCLWKRSISMQSFHEGACHFQGYILCHK